MTNKGSAFLVVFVSAFTVDWDDPHPILKSKGACVRRLVVCVMLTFGAACLYLVVQ